MHHDQTYPVYPTNEEWIGLPKYLPQTLDYGVSYYWRDHVYGDFSFIQKFHDLHDNWGLESEEEAQDE